jgi:hypothetical protein
MAMLNGTITEGRRQMKLMMTTYSSKPLMRITATVLALLALTTVSLLVGLNLKLTYDRNRTLSWLDDGHGLYHLHETETIYNVNPEPRWKPETAAPLISRATGAPSVKYILIADAPLIPIGRIEKK